MPKFNLVFASLELLLLLLVFSTNAVSNSRIQYLPGFEGHLPFELETGYVKVDEINDVQLFYYFVKSENNPADDPLLVWFSGGPGCSGLTGLAFEIGPLLFKKEEYGGSLPKLVLNPNSWTKVSNIIFLDSPVDTGFSYSGSQQGSYNSDTKSAKYAYNFIRKWLTDHPEFLSNSLYVGGDSYAGIPVPIIVNHISDGIDVGHKPLINLKGYLLGNPTTDFDLEKNAAFPFAHGMGIISDELFESAKRSCRGEYVNVNSNNALCRKAHEAVKELVSRLNALHILEPLCEFFISPRQMRTIRDRSSLETNGSSSNIQKPPGRPGFECRSYGYMLSYYWANDERVQKALNIRTGKVNEWSRCKYGSRDFHYTQDVINSVVYHSNLSKRNYRSLIYSGDHDMTVPFIATQAWIRSLNYSITEEWRAWMVDGQIAGYTRTFENNMTYATVKGGGHTAPEYKPRECFAMSKRWLSNDPL